MNIIIIVILEMKKQILLGKASHGWRDDGSWWLEVPRNPSPAFMKVFDFNFVFISKQGDTITARNQDDWKWTT